VFSQRELLVKEKFICKCSPFMREYRPPPTSVNVRSQNNMENLHRLFILDRLLRSYRRPIPTETVLTKLECSHSTFKRLIQVLREQYDYPIVYSHQQKGYYYDHSKGVQVSGLWFSTQELQALLIIRHMLQKVQPNLLNEYFHSLARQVNQLLACTGNNPEDIIKRIQIVPIAHQQIASEIFLPLSKATLEGFVMHIHYRDIQNQYSERDISPQRLIYYRNNWYLDAWCHLRKDLRTFWVAGIQSLQVKDQPAKRISEVALEQHLKSSYGIFTGLPLHIAHLRFTGQAAMRVRGSEWHPLQRQQSTEDGSVELWIPYSDSRELVLDTLRYGAEVTVLAPDTLKTEVVRQLKKALLQYENN
jgi:proteasome accessory factor C